MELKHPYPTVTTARGVRYGGDQRLSGDAVLRRCGCGVIAATDLLRYLSHWHGDCRIPTLTAMDEGGTLTQAQYDALTRRLRRYFSLLYPMGINGLGLALGLNRIFRRWGIPYTAHWGVPRAVFFERMEAQLRLDLPVILAVGPSFPRLWQRERLAMRRCDTGGETGVRAHFMTVTALDETYLTVSSWGGRYRIRRSDLSLYLRRHSSALVTNLIWLQPKRRPRMPSC